MGRGRRDAKENKANRYCTHCKWPSHNTDQCFKVVGYPDWYKGVREPLKGKTPARMAATVVGQEYSDTPLEQTTTSKDAPYSGQVDIS